MTLQRKAPKLSIPVNYHSGTDIDYMYKYKEDSAAFE